LELSIQVCMESIVDALAFVNTVLYGAGVMEKLSADDWVRAGLKALAREGFPALKADLLAKSLGISRGSFYWHFADLGAFHAAVLGRWREVAAEAIIRELDGMASGEDRLRSLLDRAFTASTSLERAVRAWAISSDEVRSVVDAVDRRRLAYIEGLLAACGIGARETSARAHILYWAYVGFALSRRQMDRRSLGALLDELAALAGQSSVRMSQSSGKKRISSARRR
jgi:AcrR family transcriptional regulator